MGVKCPVWLLGRRHQEMVVLLPAAPLFLVVIVAGLAVTLSRVIWLMKCSL